MMTEKQKAGLRLGSKIRAIQSMLAQARLAEMDHDLLLRVEEIQAEAMNRLGRESRQQQQARVSSYLESNEWTDWPTKEFFQFKKLEQADD